MLLSAHNSPPPAAAPLDLIALKNVWRASELARGQATTCTTGYPMLDHELPGAGWPRSSLTELLLPHDGVGELQLLRPTLSHLADDGTIALIQPPYIPQAAAVQNWGMDASSLLWVRPNRSADALWATEQAIKSGGFSAVLLWQSEIRTDSLRRLALACQGAETWFWLMRPLRAASDASPAPLRLSLAPAIGAVRVDIIKRRGPSMDRDLLIPLAGMPVGRHPAGVSHDASAHESEVAAAAAVRSTPLLV